MYPFIFYLGPNYSECHLRKKGGGGDTLSATYFRDPFCQIGGGGGGGGKK